MREALRAWWHCLSKAGLHRTTRLCVDDAEIQRRDVESLVASASMGFSASR